MACVFVRSLRVLLRKKFKRKQSQSCNTREKFRRCRSSLLEMSGRRVLTIQGYDSLCDGNRTTSTKKADNLLDWRGRQLAAEACGRRARCDRYHAQHVYVSRSCREFLGGSSFCDGPLSSGCGGFVSRGFS